MSSPDTYATAILAFTDAVSRNGTAFVSAMAAVGVLSMAIIQTLKDMFPLRNWFQRAFLRQWLLQKFVVASRTSGQAPDLAAGHRDLVRLATAGDEKALYDIPVEQMCGQINAAMQVALDYPRQHVDLLRLVAADADSADLERLVSAGEFAPQEGRPQEEIDARARITHHVQRAIDGFQISAGFRWKLYLQVAAFVTSFLITVIAITHFSSESPGLNQLPAVLFVGVVGGFLAPVARDLMAALQKLRSA